MRRAARRTIGVALAVAAIPFGLYGLFLILYRGESGNADTYIRIAGNEIDAHAVGAVVLLVAVSALTFAGWLIRSNGRRQAGSAAH